MCGSSQQRFCVAEKVRTVTLTLSPAVGVDGLVEIFIHIAAKAGVVRATASTRAAAAARPAMDTTLCVLMVSSRKPEVRLAVR
jgi:hypothetical protein